MDQIKKLIVANGDYIVNLRRYFRMHPEVGGQETETQKKIITELEAMGLSPKAAGGTGVLAEISGKAAGKLIALRADIDALPLEDEIDQVYRSRHSGVCHACGHDGHTAMLLGVAKTLMAMREQLPGSIRLIFQPSEERFPGGAQAMISAGAMDGAATVLGAHLWQPLEAGTIGLTSGPLMASPDEFTITVQGKGGHGSMPHQTVDSILVAAQLVLALRTITGANVDPREKAVLTLGMIKAGEVFNIIPDIAVLKGTVRTFDAEVRQTIFTHMESICRGICAASGAGFVLDPFYGYPAVVNDPAVITAIGTAAKEVFSPAGIKAVQPVMVGEDFSYYQEKAPGAFFLIGAGNKEKGAIYPHHHPKFDIDEDVLALGTETMVRAALKLME